MGVRELIVSQVLVFVSRYIPDISRPIDPLTLTRWIPSDLLDNLWYKPSCIRQLGRKKDKRDRQSERSNNGSRLLKCARLDNLWRMCFYPLELFSYPPPEGPRFLQNRR